MERRFNRPEADGFADLLRREAARDRPVYSAVVHERMLRQLPVEHPGRAVIHVAEAWPVAAGHAGWRRLGPAAAVAAVLATVIAIIGPRPDRATARPRTVTVAQPGERVGAAVEAEALGIDQVPTFAELDAEVRESVSTLAATLLDVPEWRMLADFDAAGFLGMEAAR